MKPGDSKDMTLVSAMISRPVMANAIRVSLVVGTCLNAINQGPNIWRGEALIWDKLLLNFAVPFLVASYSAAKARNAMQR